MANPLVGAAGVAAGGSLIGGAMASSASKKAANTQAAAADRASQLQQESADKQLALQKEMYYKNIDLQSPFREAGLTSQNKLMAMLGIGGDTSSPDYGKYAKDFSMTDFNANADPGAGFRFDEGMKALNATAAARGGLISGGALKAATRYGQDLGSQEYQNAFNRYQTNRTNQLTPLQSLMGAGQTASNAIGNAGTNYASSGSTTLGNSANAIGDLYTQAGNAKASGYVGSANAWGNALGNATNVYNQNQMINRMFPQGGGGSPSIFTPSANYLAPAGGGFSA